MIETQDTVAPINNRIRTHKPNGNHKEAKKGNYVNCNASIDVNESDSNFSEENIDSTLNVSEMIETQDTGAPINNRIRVHKPNGNRSILNISEIIETQDTVAPINNRIRACKSKRNYVDHNAPIDINESDQSLSEKNIKSALNDSKIFEIQDITAPTIKKN
ncbi:hypothetical protein F8M41_016534 [Gigaspora margarita]|uniref:Uncharacterized protein n=1 Tax=Gigaspora margarita TaxID=4874 RepID=A0A8H4B3A4_GIGMA|nr:hypothetical protein F8M41_016534 [Gigaspora margarita]